MPHRLPATRWPAERGQSHARHKATLPRSQAAAALAIYQAGIDEDNAAFGTRARLARLHRRPAPRRRYVTVDANTVISWVAVSATSRRPARGVVGKGHRVVNRPHAVAERRSAQPIRPVT